MPFLCDYDATLKPGLSFKLNIKPYKRFKYRGGVIIPVKHKCAKSGCNELISISDRYCSKHTGYNERRYNRLRQTTQHDYIKFYHSKEWKQLRSLKLIDNPICESCLRNGIITQANTVHHRNDVTSHWSERLNYDNLESLCKSCHEKIYKGRRYP